MKVGNYELDGEQQKAIASKCKNVLVIAGAGSGKTTTIVGKIKQLVNELHIDPKNILCISFTNASVLDLLKRIEKENVHGINVFTFHKLGLKILEKANIDYTIASNSLKNIIDEFFLSVIFNYEEIMYATLKYFNPLIFKVDIKKQYRSIMFSNKIVILKQMIQKYISLLKTNGYGIEKFDGIYNQFYKTRNFYFFKVVLFLYQFYEEELHSSNELDFDDIIVEATKYVSKVDLDYQYIFVDEFQDTSRIRFNLIKAVVLKCNSNLFAVGDDFQSIYRFSGCDLNIMLNFKNEFENTEILKITNTYRNSKQLLDVAGNFVMKNPKQIKKELMSFKTVNNPIILIKFMNKKQRFKRFLLNLNENSILILGRNNKDIYEYIDDDYTYSNGRLILKGSNIEITYMTIHKSKGLEADCVAIINLEDKKLGLPSKIKEDKIFSTVFLNNEKYLYAEERRLFYVALTRTKKYVYLFIPYSKPSVFVKEIYKIVKSSKKQ